MLGVVPNHNLNLSIEYSHNIALEGLTCEMISFCCAKYTEGREREREGEREREKSVVGDSLLFVCRFLQYTSCLCL